MRSERKTRATGLFLVGFLAVGLGLGCSGKSELSETPNPLYVDPAARDFSRNPELLQRVVASPHRYFRFINIPFSQEVCRRYGDLIEGTPLFNLHGDAHIEQYAITDLGRGLTDFDDSSTGPALIDLLRFGTSLRVACHGHDCGDLDATYNEFLRGYRDALEDPGTDAPEPTVARRVRGDFKYDRQRYLEWVGSVMEPMPESEKDALEAAMAPYVEAMFEQDRDLDGDFFEIVDAGYLRMGVGSALDIKYLVRVRGATDEPLDDDVLEIKEVRELEDIECIRVSQGSDPFRVLLGQTRIAYEPFGHLGYIRLQGRSFWIHAWVENYKEVEIGESLVSPVELAEVAYDVGIQLGRGHSNQIGAPLDTQLRREQVRILDRDRDRLRQAVRELAELTLEAWQMFRTESGQASES
ncbi:MAG: DUF2252 domain-containing protein [bacterium]|nr:DUF2252 domain-containing protein [bacterium]